MTNVIKPTDSGNYRHFGLAKIFTNAKKIDYLNVVTELNKAIPTFTENQKQIRELQDIFKGDQIILKRTPSDNQPVNERVNMNLFPALATTWVGLILGEKTDYVLRGSIKDETKTKDMDEIIKHIRWNDDVLLDKESLNDLFICGVAYQYSGGQSNETKPALLTTIACDSCFIIQSREIGHPVLAAVIESLDELDKTQYTVFTDTYRIIAKMKPDGQGLEVVQSIRHFLPQIPIQEIKLNPQYLSMVAQGESAQNALNMAVSESINDTIYQMRSLLLITGGELTGENIEAAKKYGVLNVTTTDGRTVSGGYLSKPLDETITGLRSMLFDVLYFIMGIPSTDGGTSGNTGAAIVASGMQTMDLVAYSIQLEIKKAKTAMLDNLIKVLRIKNIIKSDITAIDIDIAFDRQLVMNLVQAADAFAKLKEAGFPNKDNLKVTKLTSDIDKVAAEMDKLAKELEDKARTAVLDSLKAKADANGQSNDPNAEKPIDTNVTGGTGNA